MPNIFEPHFDEPRKHPGFDCRRARIGRQAGAERLGASVWDVPPPGGVPVHFHYVEEELLFVLSSGPSLRTPDGRRDASRPLPLQRKSERPDRGPRDSCLGREAEATAPPAQTIAPGAKR